MDQLCADGVLNTHTAHDVDAEAAYVDLLAGVAGVGRPLNEGDSAVPVAPLSVTELTLGWGEGDKQAGEPKNEGEAGDAGADDEDAEGHVVYHPR